MLLGTHGANGPRDVSVSDSVTRDNGSHGLHFIGSSGRPMAVEVDHLRSARNDHGILAQNDVRGTVTDSHRQPQQRKRHRGGRIGRRPGLARLERVTTTGNDLGALPMVTARRSPPRTAPSNTTAPGSPRHSGQLVSRVNNTLTDNTTNGAFTSTIAAAFRPARRRSPNH